MTLFRIPVRWERLQPALFGPLDRVNVDALRRNLAWAAAGGGKVILDVHNYGRYKFREGAGLSEYVLDNVYDGAVRVPGAALADLWSRLSSEFKADPGVYAYDLMNEPHDMGRADWKAVSQAALTAIRANGDNTLVMVAGDSWSSAPRWPQVHGPAGWISDPANNFAYEAHLYFDSDGSGTYVNSYDQELAANRELASVGRARLAPFVNWCRDNRARCFLGEYGVPGNDPRWLPMLDDFLAALDEAGLDGTYWAGGEWWGDYPLSAHPLGNFTIDRPQMPVLQAHLGRAGLSAAVPAASYSGTLVAPGSLAAIFGTNLAPGIARADTPPWPTTLGGVRLELTDSTGQTVAAPLLMVAPGQINFLVPESAAPGRGGLALRAERGLVAGGALEVARVAPGLFSAAGDGQGLAAAQVLRLRPGGAQSYEPVARFDASTNQFVPVPIDFGAPEDRLFLILYGTGWRNIATTTAAALRVGTAVAPVVYAGPQPDLPGMDQVNAELPRSLAGAGEVRIVLSIEGRQANPLIVVFR